MSRPPPARRAEYRAFRALPTRWMDNDAYGHMNNATYFSLFDTAISLWQMEQGLVIDGPDPMRFLVVESGCRYHAEAGFPDMIHAGLRLGHLGRSSFRTEVGLFRNDDDTACAEGFFAQVYVDAAGTPTALPAPLITALNTLA
ncbi:MAG: acyl-CoA thioesterase [Paracoccaceae bacterium]|nr:acyl-CoA thioesterase [Paracoccaceae bacterium]